MFGPETLNASSMDVVRHLQWNHKISLWSYLFFKAHFFICCNHQLEIFGLNQDLQLCLSGITNLSCFKCHRHLNLGNAFHLLLCTDPSGHTECILYNNSSLSCSAFIDQYYRFFIMFYMSSVPQFGKWFASAVLHRPLQAIMSAATTTILHYHALLLWPIIPQIAFLTMLCFHPGWSIWGAPKMVCYKMVHHFYFHVWWSSVVFG